MRIQDTTENWQHVTSAKYENPEYQ